MTTQIRPKRFRLRRSSPQSGSADLSAKDQPEQQPASAAQAGTDAPPVRKRPSRGLMPDAGYEADAPGLADEADAPAADASAKPVVAIRKKRKPAATDASAAASPPSGPDTAETATPTPTGTADLEGKPAVQNSIEAIRAEGLTARQLRMAMRVAQKHGIRASSAHEAVLMLRERGIDPLARSTMLELVSNDPPAQGRELATRPESAPALPPAEDPVNAAKDRMARIAAERDKELRKVQRDIARRRRKRLIQLGMRLLVFVTLPTFIASWYFYVIATPMYATDSQFVIQQADGGAGGELAGLLPSAGGMGMGGQNEAASVQSYLQSRAAMRRLDAEEGFKAHFSDDQIDLLRRLPPDASDEAAFRLFKRHVLIGYDPTEGVVRLEVIAATPEDSERFSRALIRFAEEHVDMMTQRLRDSQMNEARQSLEDAQQKLIEARLAVVDLQEQSSVLSGEVELSLLSQQIGALEAELTQTRLSLQEMRSNPRPNPARLQPLERREEALRAQVESLRASMTRDSNDGVSLARTQSQLIMAEAEVQTREMMRAQAMQQLESARIEVGRQVRYLALSVEPVAPDEATYPRKLENSALAFLIFLGIYLFVSMTGSVLREQIAG